MLEPTASWVKFENNSDKLVKYKEWGFVPKTSFHFRTLYYSGCYVNTPVKCDIVGITESGLAVITLNESYHCIHPDYLKQMQPSQSIPTEYVVFDFETTGFSPKKDKIIEIGAIKFKDGKIIDTFDMLVNPECPIPFGATQVNHIDNEMVIGSPCINIVLPQFIEFIEDFPLVAHNAKFDVGFLKENAKMIHVKITNPIYDTLELSRKAFPQYPSHSLQNLLKNLKINIHSAHRSLPDTQATVILFQKCFEVLYPVSIISENCEE